MTKPLIGLQDLRRRIYAKAKSDTSWRFWGLYVHVCKEETLHEAYLKAKAKDGAPGIDGVTFEAIEAGGVDVFLGQLRDELVSRKYVPMPNRRKEIPKDGGKKVRVLGIPAPRQNLWVTARGKLWPRPVDAGDRGPNTSTRFPARISAAWSGGRWAFRPRRSGTSPFAAAVAVHPGTFAGLRPRQAATAAVTVRNEC